MILKSGSCHAVKWMQIRMKNSEALAPERMDDFLEASTEIEFTGQGRQEVYDWIVATLVEQEYFTLRKKQRGRAAISPHRVTGFCRRLQARIT